MPRAGSEVLQVLLHQNPRIYAGATSPLLEYQFAARGNYELPEVKSQDSKIMQQAFLSMCKGMADSYYSAVTDRPIVIDKNRGWAHYYEWVEQWNSDPKIICMVRDLRSIISSMEKIYRKNRFRPAGPDNPTQLSNMTIYQRTNHWLSNQPVGLALMRTMDTFNRDLNKKMLFIRYEDLCENPQATMKKLYQFIGEEYYEHDFNNITKVVYEDDSHFGPYGNHSVASKLSVIPKDYNEILGKDVAAKLRSDYSWYFDTFGY